MSSPVPMPSRPSTRIWLRGTVPVSGRSTCVFTAAVLGNSHRVMQILRVVEIEKTDDVRRPYIKQLLTPKLKFPLPHRVGKSRSTFVAHRPATF